MILIHCPDSELGTATGSHDILDILFVGQTRRVFVRKRDIFTIRQDVKTAACNRDGKRLASVTKVGPVFTIFNFMIVAAYTYCESLTLRTSGAYESY